MIRPCMRVGEFVRSICPLRRRLFCGGCSRVEYQRIGAWWHGPVVSTDIVFLRKISCPGTLAGSGCWVVFGTLLGPEATGPGFFPWGGFRVCLFLVSWLHRACT